MKCPICGSELLEGPGRRFENLSDHVSDPNSRIRPLRQTFECHGAYHLESSDKDIKCPMGDSGFWDDYGDFYNQTDYDIYKRIEKLCDKNMTEALGSHARKSHTEIYKKDEEFVLFRTFKYKWIMNFNYEANMDGDIVKRRPYVQRLRKDDISWVYDFPWWKMFFHSWKVFRNHLKRYKESPNKWVRDQIKTEFEPLPDWDRRFYRRFYKAFLHIFYSNVENRIKALELLGE